LFFKPLDRRVFLKGTAAAGLALPFADAVRTEAREVELVARKVFFDNADCYNVRVSPDGKNLACDAIRVRGLALSRDLNPSPGLHLTMRSDLSLRGFV
jgi:hypothetical protein